MSFNKDEIMDVKWVPIDELKLMTKRELRSYDSTINIIRDLKNNKNYPIEIINNSE